MKIFAFLASAFVVVCAYSSLPVRSMVPKDVASASKAAGFLSLANHSAVLQPQYQRFASLLAQQNKPSYVQKGLQRTQSIVRPTTVLAAEFGAANNTVPLLPVFNQPDIKPHQQKILNEALQSLPQKCWSTLQQFYIRYDHPANRGLAGATTMILDGNLPDDEFRSVFMHEIGHVFDLNTTHPDCLSGTAASGASAFKDGTKSIYNDDPSVQFYRISWVNEYTKHAGTQVADFVSGYAGTDPFEDFAESHIMFVLHNDTFRSLGLQNAALAAKYNFFLRYLYPEGINIASSKNTSSSKRPWDATKLPYTWL